MTEQRIIFKSHDGRTTVRVMNGIECVGLDIMGDVSGYAGAVLTPSEARELADALRRQADCAQEHDPEVILNSVASGATRHATDQREGEK